MKWTDEQILKLQISVNEELEISPRINWIPIQQVDFPDCSLESLRSAWKKYGGYTVPLGTAQLPSTQRIERLAILGDTHIPFHDEAALELTYRILDAFGPTSIVHIGDLVDMHELSSFAKGFDPAQTVREIAQARKFLEALRERYPDASLRWIFGNHEYRWDRFIASKARELHGLLGMTLLEQIEPGRYDVKTSYSGLKESYFEYKPNLLIGHWNKVSVNSAYTANALLRDTSLIQGHTHRLGAHFRCGHAVQLGAWENGCLCRLDPAYVLDPNWQQGFSLVCYDNQHELFSVRQVAIQQVAKNNGGMLYWAEFNGEVYEA